MSSPRLTLACGMVCSLLASATPSVEASYPTPSARASIRRDDAFKRIGQYLLIEEPPGKGDRVVESVLDIPEHWRVQSVHVGKEGVTLTCEGGTRYRLTRRNVGSLSFAILDGSPQTRPDAELEALWREHALFEPKAQGSAASRTQ